MSVLVPPMSIVMMSAKPDSPATCALATTPPAGPDSTVCTGLSRAVATVINPPEASMTMTGTSSASPSPSAGSASNAIRHARYRHDRQQKSVERDRAGPLVLAELGQNLGRDNTGTPGNA